MSFVILTDSSADLPLEYYAEHDIHLIEMTVELEGKEFPDDGGRSMPYADFYAALRAGQVAKTSQINAYEFIQKFEPFLKEGKDLLYFGLTAGLSGSYQQSRLAAEELSAKYPGRRIYVVESSAVALGLGLLVHEVAKLRDAGAGIDELRDYIESNKLRFQHLFTVADLMFLHRGGRVSKTSAVVGSLLSIKPLLFVSDEGKLTPKDKVRGRRQSLERMVDWMGELLEDIELDGVFISHGDCLEDAEFVGHLVQERYKVRELMIGMLGCTIGAHSGPGTVALFFQGKPRTPLT